VKNTKHVDLKSALLTMAARPEGFAKSELPITPSC